MFFKIVVLINFAIFTGKHLFWSLFLIKLQALTVFDLEIILQSTNAYPIKLFNWNWVHLTKTLEQLER